MAVLSQLADILTAPDRLLFLGVVIGTLLTWRRRTTGGAPYLLLVLTVCWALVSILPIANGALGILDQRFGEAPELPDRVEGIIVLSGSENAGMSAYHRQPVLGDTAERLTTFIALARQYPEARLIVSDGAGAGPRGNQATTGTLLFIELGLDLDRIEFETSSRNTYENAVASHDMIRPSGEDRYVLITSAFHMPRSVGTFRAAGWNVIPYPVDFRTGPNSMRLRFQPASSLLQLGVALHEWVGLVSYRALGRTDAVFPGPESR
jgi:uncharacterized SAM-binding protein YcdF (DUF218 family)